MLGKKTGVLFTISPGNFELSLSLSISPPHYKAVVAVI